MSLDSNDVNAIKASLKELSAKADELRRHL
jgi:hypothetical protein